LRAQRARGHCHVGLSAVALSRALDCALRPDRDRAGAPRTDRGGVGRRFRLVRRRLCRELFGPARDRPSLPRRLLPRRSSPPPTPPPPSPPHSPAPAPYPPPPV